MSNHREADLTDNFVEEAMHRAPMLQLLAVGPRDTHAVANELDISRSTVHRATEELCERGLIRKSDEQLELTTVGEAVATEICELQGNLAAARELEPFLNTIDASTVEVPLAAFRDATVVTPEHRQAHVGVKRIIERIEETDSLRMFSSVLSPLYVDVAHREILDGTEIEVLFDRTLVDLMVSKYGEEATEAFETGRFRVFVGESIPFELFLFDDRMGMAAHDESGIARAFVECSAPEAIDWARAVYERYAEGAQRFEMD